MSTEYLCNNEVFAAEKSQGGNVSMLTGVTVGVVPTYGGLSFIPGCNLLFYD